VLSLPALALATGLLAGQAPATPSPAAPAASTSQEVERIFAEGAALYKAGKYRAAIERFENAYALFPEPNLLYNMARSYEALGEAEQALTKYRVCSTHPRATDELKQKAIAKIAVLESAQTSSATAAADPTASPSAPTTTTTTSTPVTGATAPAQSAGPPVLGIAGGVTTAVGVAGAVTGGVLFYLGASTHTALQNDLDDNPGVVPYTRAEAEALSADGTMQKTVGVVALTAGGALAVVGGSMLVMQMMGGE
jgi:tetratricopeptide (TPR) repeat protein